MFRGCYFEYAEQLSNEYNLRLYYYDRTVNTFNSGGEYELITEALPNVVEQQLYGLKYSDKPLEFDIEIMNPDDAIPFNQVIEIKNWLFGQDGWKKFKTIDERQDYHLKCVLIPQEDIIDGLGVRGFKCKLRNISAFWYGEPVVIEFDYAYLNDPSRKQTTKYIVEDSESGVRHWTPFEINIDSSDSAFDMCDILPDITVAVNSNTGDSTEGEIFYLGVSNYSSVSDMIKAYEQKQEAGKNGISPTSISPDVSSAIEFVGAQSISFAHMWNISTKYLTIDRGGFSESTDCLSVGSRGFRLTKGINICFVSIPEAISNLRFSYTPLYRIGAF